jgi:hypothetical protein
MRYRVKAALGYVSKATTDDEVEYTEEKDDALPFETEEGAKAAADELGGEVEEAPDLGGDEEPPPEEPPAELKHSAHVMAKLYQHAKDEGDYLDGELTKMDNPPAAEALGSYRDEHVGNRMEALKAMLGEHHPDHDMDELMDHPQVKGMEAEMPPGGPESQPGEAGMTSLGDIPPATKAEAFAGEETPEEEALEGHYTPPSTSDIPGSGDTDTEEILERYEEPGKGWRTRKAGRVSKRFAKLLVTTGQVRKAPRDGRLYVVKGGRIRRKDGAYVESTPDNPEDTGTAPFNKGMDDEVNDIEAACGMMKDMMDDEEVPKRYKGELAKHTTQLSYVSKALTDMGKVQRNGGPGSVLSDKGKVQRGGDQTGLTDEGELQTSAGTPSDEIVKPGPDGGGEDKGDANQPLGKGRVTGADVAKAIQQTVATFEQSTGLRLG